MTLINFIKIKPRRSDACLITIREELREMANGFEDQFKYIDINISKREVLMELIDPLCKTIAHLRYNYDGHDIDLY